MVERIRLLLEARQLTPTQFADAIGIARPIVSHILSGRNKPSLEVVQRILSALPDLSMAWLLNGTGTMLSGAKVPDIVPSPAPTSATVPSRVVEQPAPRVPVDEVSTSPSVLAAPQPPKVAPPVKAKVFSAAVSPGPKRFAPGMSTPVASSAAQATVANPVGMLAETEPPATLVGPLPMPTTPLVSLEPSDAPGAAALLAGTDKSIRRIVIFYRDGSFADFQPE